MPEAEANDVAASGDDAGKHDLASQVAVAVKRELATKVEAAVLLATKVDAAVLLSIPIVPIIVSEGFEIKTQLGPLNIKLSAPLEVVSALTLDLVRGTPTPSPADEPKIECEILFEKQLITATQSRASVAGYILDLLRGYPTVAAVSQRAKGA